MEIGSSFHRVLWDNKDARLEGGLKPAKDIRRVVMCSGKVYYDLLEARDAAGLDDVYIMRLEQLYPFPIGALLAELEPYAHAEMVWCQEEPRNMGAWSYVEPEIEGALQTLGATHKRPQYAGRRASASTATGLLSRHMSERDALLAAALTEPVE
jgi:2-oxoglutarate dehydrogenase E1 component